jgi:hypothetical protein
MSRPFRAPGPARCVVLATALLATLSLAAAKPAAVSAAPARAPEPVKQPRLEDWIAEPGSSQKFQPFMLHADQWFGIDQRAKLDTIVFVLENGGRICQVLNRDSTWAVDYTWVYPHNLLPPRWYDAKALVQAGDSLKLADDADLKLTFGTMRMALRAGSLQHATAEAYRKWPAQMPVSLAGRLKLKLERAKKALEAEQAAAKSGKK